MRLPGSWVLRWNYLDTHGGGLVSSVGIPKVDYEKNQSALYFNCIALHFVSMNSIDIPGLVAALLESGTDRWNIEAKSARGGLPNTLDETLSAFANMPEGGTILLGVSETPQGIEVTGVNNPAACAQGLAGKARERVVPPVQLGAVEWESIDGATVVACVVPPQPSDRRPFRVGKHGPAFIRVGEGDYRLSEQEELYLVSQRAQPVFDGQPIEGASVEKDLVPELLEQYLESQRRESPRLRSMGRDELLVRTSVVDHETTLPTLAAVYAMGVHPQQFLPQTTVKAHAEPMPNSDTSLRLADRAEFSGPVPDLLDAALDWVNKHLMHGVAFSGGRGFDMSEIPEVAVREIVANALVHRDLSPASFGSYPMLVKQPTRLIVKNPGGLWGLSERELGRTSPRARNAVLYKMCSSITSASGARVIEGHATGIPEVRRALREAFLPEPFFKDEVIEFTAIVTSSSVLPTTDIEWLNTLPAVESLSVAQKHALVAMRNGEDVSNSDYRSRFPMDSVEARDELQELVRFGLAHVTGSGRGTKYILGRQLNEQRGIVSRAETAAHARPKDREAVRAALQELREPSRRSAIAQAAGLTENQTYRALQQLIQEGEVTSEKDPADKRAFLYALVDFK